MFLFSFLASKVDLSDPLVSPFLCNPGTLSLAGLLERRGITNLQLSFSLIPATTQHTPSHPPKAHKHAYTNTETSTLDVSTSYSSTISSENLRRPPSYTSTSIPPFASPSASPSEASPPFDEHPETSSSPSSSRRCGANTRPST